MPTEGEGSEYGRKWKEEARKKRRGMNRRQDPDDNPWVLKEKKRGGKQSVIAQSYSVIIILMERGMLLNFHSAS